ncbi:hypothetical protein CGRA01v4_07178 [Colletotrichum graminicola]|nr:hypothetical protein CGRA01v4_07178 [Colletotrichum graminicola]
MNVQEPEAARTGSSGTGLIIVLVITFILADFFCQLDPSREREGGPLMQTVSFMPRNNIKSRWFVIYI